jgi:hypothetical protein
VKCPTIVFIVSEAFVRNVLTTIRGRIPDACFV